jgi:hypothetical protein
MAEIFRLFELHVADEGSFCENAEAVGSLTYSARLPIQGVATMRPVQERIRDGGARSRANEESLSHMGARECELEFTTYAPGHGAAPTGALTENWAYDLLKDGLGGGTAAAVATAISGTASTATSLNVTDASTYLAGGILRVGVKGDTKGEGHPAVIDSINTGATPDAIALLTGLPTAPVTAGHVIYPTMVAYHDESTMGSLVTKRFMGGHTTTGAQIHMLGMQLAGKTYNIPLSGNLPTITWRYRGAYWQRGAVTIPSASPSFVECATAPVAGSRMFINDVATATSATIVPGSIDLAIDLGLEPIPGPGCAGTFQQISGWQRTMCKPTLNLMVPTAVAIATYEAWWDTVNPSIAYKHLLFSYNNVAGRCFGFYLPRMMPVGQRPSMVTELNGLNYTPLTLVGVDAASGTELQRSAIRFFIG